MIHEELSKMVETHECAQCGMPLVLIWDKDRSDYALVCGADRSHEGYKLHEGLSTVIARGKSDKLLGPGAQTDMERAMSKAAHPLSLLPDKDIGDGKIITPERLKGLVAWGESLGLKAYLGHVCLYYGKPYVTIDGYYYKLHGKGTELACGTHPLSVDKRELYQVPEGSHAWIAEAWVNGVKLPTTGLGIVPIEEIEGKSAKNPNEFRAPVVHGHPQRMAEKRAEWQLLRKLVPIDEVPAERR